MEIKTYSPTYKIQLCKLILDIQNNEFNIPITLEEQEDLNNIETFYQKDKGNFWLALVDNEVVGTISLLDIGNKNGALRKMFVKQEFRGKEFGIANKLLQTLLEYSKEKGFERIFLGTTSKFLAAHKFYEKSAFIQIDEKLLPKEFPIMKVDTRFYQYKVL